MASTKNTIAPAKTLRSQELCAGTEAESTRTRELLLQSHALLEEYQSREHQCEQLVEPRASSPQPKTTLPELGPGARKRSKLVHKNRWLISVDIVAALRRAGVNCDIVMPLLYVDVPGSTRH